MIHNGNRARLPSFPSERPCTCRAMRVRACVSVPAEACEWQAVSERDVIIWLMSVRVRTRGRVTSLAASWHSGQETLLYDFPTRGKHSRHSRRSCHPISFCGYSTVIHPKKHGILTTIKWKETHLWTVYLVLFLQEPIFLSQFICFVREASKRGLSLPLPVLTLWLLRCNNNTGVLVQCPAVDLLVRW